MERLILFAKRPRLGAVKTRLVPPLEPAEALELYRAFVADSLALLRAGAVAGRAAELCLDGPWSPEYGSLDLAGLLVTEQGPGDLGERLLRAFRRSHAAGSCATVIVGADSPTLPPERIEQAFAQLGRGARVVLAPAEDGGYVLLGLREPVAELFAGLPWGGPGVARLTRERAAALGLGCAVLESWYDVDDAPALARLAAELRGGPASPRAPATRGCLARLGPRLDARRGGVI